MTKLRADELLVRQGLAESREKAKRLVMAGLVLVRVAGREVPVDKPGQQLPADVELRLRATERFVGRGGEKLETAFAHFGIEVAGRVCLDVGAATGGFTDCLLQHGAARVYAVDVGRGLLHEKIRRDPRVVCIEDVNVRHAPENLLPEPVDLIVADVSFISLTLVLPACLQFLKPIGEIVALVKPQFELGVGETDKGVVRSEEKRQEAVRRVVGFAERELGLEGLGVVPSKLKGPKGNQEYLAWFRRRAS